MSTQLKDKSQAYCVEDYFDLGQADLQDAILTQDNSHNYLENPNIDPTNTANGNLTPHFGYNLNQPNASFYKKSKLG